MAWGIFHIFVSSVEQLLIGVFLEQVQPIIALALFYSVATIATYLSVRACLKQEFNWTELWKEKKIAILYFVCITLGNFLWFLSIVAIGLGATSIVMLLLRVVQVGYGVLFLDGRMLSLIHI